MAGSVHYPDRMSFAVWSWSAAVVVAAAGVGVQRPDAGRERVERAHDPGVALLTVSLVTGVAAAGFKLVGTIADLETSRDIDAGRISADCAGGCFSPEYNAIAGGFWIHSIGLMGAGLELQARARGGGDVRAGRDRSRRARILMGTGFGAIGLGVAVFAAGQVVLHLVELPTARARASLVEATWWSSVAAGYAGAAMAGWGVGTHRGREQELRRLGVAPMVHRNVAGVVLRGRF